MASDQHKRPSIRLESDGAVVRYSPLDIVTVGQSALPRAMTITVPGPDDLPTVVVDIAVRDNRAVCVGVHVTSDPDVRAVRLDDVAGLPLDELVAQAVTLAAESLDADGDGVVIDERAGSEPERQRAARRAAARDTVRGMRSGSYGATDAQLQAIADTWHAHDGNAPVQAVMDAHGLTRATAFRRISRARAAGLLPPSQRAETMKRGSRKGGGKGGR